MQFKNVFIATPTHTCKRYCSRQFVDSVIKHAPGARFLIVANSKSNPAHYYKHPGVEFVHLKLDTSFYNHSDSVHKRIVRSVEFTRELFLGDSRYTHYLSLESDVILAENVLARMLAHDVPVITANCYRDFFHGISEVSQVDRITMGCTLIRRDALTEIRFRYDPSLLAAHYDAFFAHDCNQHQPKIPIWYDPSIYVEHQHDTSGSRGWRELPPQEVT